MMKKYNILVLDDDPYTLEIFELLSEIIKNCTIYTAIDFESAKQIVHKENINLIILDIIMPEIDGYEVCKILKQYPNSENAYYIFMSSDKHQLLDRLKAYTIGAQDFISKPFDIKEIELIINSKIQYFRSLQNTISHSQTKNIINSGNFLLDNKLKKVTINGKEIELTSLEYKLMEFFILNSQKALTIDDIGNGVWGGKGQTSPENIRTLIYKLRAKIELNSKNNLYIINSKSNGYIFYPAGENCF